MKMVPFKRWIFPPYCSTYRDCLANNGWAVHRFRISECPISSMRCACIGNRGSCDHQKKCPVQDDEQAPWVPADKCHKRNWPLLVFKTTKMTWWFIQRINCQTLLQRRPVGLAVRLVNRGGFIVFSLGKDAFSFSKLPLLLEFFSLTWQPKQLGG